MAGQLAGPQSGEVAGAPTQRLIAQAPANLAFLRTSKRHQSLPSFGESDRGFRLRMGPCAIGVGLLSTGEVKERLMSGLQTLTRCSA